MTSLIFIRAQARLNILPLYSALFNPSDEGVQFLATTLFNSCGRGVQSCPPYSEAVWGAYNDLDIGTQLMIADNLAFCPECHSIFEMQKDKNGEPVKVRRKKKTYKEIAMLNELSEEESVRVALQKGYEEMRKEFLSKDLKKQKFN